MTAAPALQAVSIALSLMPCMVLLLLVELIRVSRMNRCGQTASSMFATLAYGRTEMTRTILNTWFVPIAFPIAIAGIADLAATLHVVGPNQGLFGTIACTISISAFVTLLLPHLFVKLIGAGPVDETVFTAVESTWRLGSPRVPRILLWPTGCRMANAAVVGLFGFGRKLLLTDALIQRLSERELAMVVLHELAHCTRFHAWVRMMPTLVIVLLLLGSMAFLTGFWLSATCALLFLLFVASLIAVCWWTEFDADRVAIETAVRSSGALDRETQLRRHASDLCEALRKIYGEKNMQRRSWMHPSGTQRLEAIQGFAAQSASGNCNSFEPMRSND
jgi:Zn-dependent protease with chaperone function